MAGQIVGDRQRMALRQIEIVPVAVVRIGMAEHVDGRPAELLQDRRNGIQRRHVLAWPAATSAQAARSR